MINTLIYRRCFVVRSKECLCNSRKNSWCSVVILTALGDTRVRIMDNDLFCKTSVPRLLCKGCACTGKNNMYK